MNRDILTFATRAVGAMLRQEHLFEPTIAASFRAQTPYWRRQFLTIFLSAFDSTLGNVCRCFLTLEALKLVPFGTDPNGTSLRPSKAKKNPDNIAY